MGELGWTQERWHNASMTEFNYAVGGYWRNWERNVGIPIREICFNQIGCSPNKFVRKPSSAKMFLPLSIDKNKTELMTLKEYEDFLELRKKVVWQSKN